MFTPYRTNVISTLVLLVLLSISANPAQAQTRSSWVYEENGGGYFEHTGGSFWTEFTAASSFTFREVARTGTYIQLHDASRKVSVRVYRTRCYIAHPGSGGWKPLYKGYWK